MSWLLLLGAVLVSMGMIAFAFWLVGPSHDVWSWLMNGRRSHRKHLWN